MFVEHHRTIEVSSWSARLGPASEPFQPRRRYLTDEAIDENGREIGLFLDVAADPGVGRVSDLPDEEDPPKTGD